MATQKTELPTLAGKRVKTRKRDEKVKYDPKEFSEQLITSLNEAKTLEEMSKYLDKAGSEMDYRYTRAYIRVHTHANDVVKVSRTFSTVAMLNSCLM